jgi:hypothetical protein
VQFHTETSSDLCANYQQDTVDLFPSKCDPFKLPNSNLYHVLVGSPRWGPRLHVRGAKTLSIADTIYLLYKGVFSVGRDHMQESHLGAILLVYSRDHVHTSLTHSISMYLLQVRFSEKLFFFSQIWPLRSKESIIWCYYRRVLSG